MLKRMTADLFELMEIPVGPAAVDLDMTFLIRLPDVLVRCLVEVGCGLPMSE
jgi:hypothetical protein